MKYSEEKSFTEKYKKNYVSGIEHIIEMRQKEAEEKRQKYTENFFENQEKFRDDFKKMLGWPLVDFDSAELPNVTSEKLADEDGYEIYRMQFEILDGLTLTGLFFKDITSDKKPLVLVQHGGLGTPERISGFYDGTANYNDMLERVRKNNVHVFAPQLLLWSDEYKVEFDRINIDARLKRVGSSITAVEVFSLTKILDYFETQDYVSSFGMVGLSYGGFYTLCLSAADTRIKSAISCSFFNKRDAVPWSDWTWFNSSEKFDDAEIACLTYPRNLYIAMGDSDELFDYKNSLSSFERLEQMCKTVGTDWVTLKIFSGTHEFFHDDEPIKKLISDLL